MGRGPYWELSEMEGKLCATSTDERVDASTPSQPSASTCIAWGLIHQLQNAAISELVDVNMIRSSNFNEFGSFSTLDIFAPLKMFIMACRVSTPHWTLQSSGGRPSGLPVADSSAADMALGMEQ